MALTNIVHRAASRVAPLAARALGGQRCFHHHHHCSAVGGGVSRKIQLFRSSVPLALHQYSTKSDVSLFRLIELEMKFVEQQINEYAEAEAIPSGYPFKLEDNPGQLTVTLTRDYQGENIDVEVHITKLITGEGDDDTKTIIPLVVRISGNNRPCLEFGVTAYHDKIAINSVLVKESDSSEDEISYEGPDFRGFGWKMQNAFYKYLETRGIKPSITNFLHGYMINKKCKEYARWLNNLKKIVEP